MFVQAKCSLCNYGRASTHESLLLHSLTSPEQGSGKQTLKGSSEKAMATSICVSATRKQKIRLKIQSKQVEAHECKTIQKDNECLAKHFYKLHNK